MKKRMEQIEEILSCEENSAGVRLKELIRNARLPLCIGTPAPNPSTDHSPTGYFLSCLHLNDSTIL